MELIKMGKSVKLKLVLRANKKKWKIILIILISCHLPNKLRILIKFLEAIVRRTLPQMM